MLTLHQWQYYNTQPDDKFQLISLSSFPSNQAKKNNQQEQDFLPASNYAHNIAPLL